MFTDNFDGYVCAGEKIECVVNGITYTARIVTDICASIDNDDMHNIDQSVTGCDLEFPAIHNARASCTALLMNDPD